MEACIPRGRVLDIFPKILVARQYALFLGFISSQPVSK
jgi:hypothetical protein